MSMRPLRFVPYIIWRIFIQNWYDSKIQKGLRPAALTEVKHPLYLVNRFSLCTSQTSNLLYITLQVWQEIEETLLLAMPAVGYAYAEIKKVSITIFINKYFLFSTNVFLDL
ncbi:hypothetical protein [Nostoc sp.]|uniref:hypothetical protein n=1 Tax=Nostoc sp. TaxID=1180 RepID=UPI002FF4BDF6